jgi:hypothetical protein
MPQAAGPPHKVQAHTYPLAATLIDPGLGSSRLPRSPTLFRSSSRSSNPSSPAVSLLTYHYRLVMDKAAEQYFTSESPSSQRKIP